MQKQPKPRSANFYGMRSNPIYFGMQTWLEPEEITYPSGSMIRRARAVNAETGKLQVVRCGIADTFFSISTRDGGYLSMNGSDTNPILVFHPKKRG